MKLTIAFLTVSFVAACSGGSSSNTNTGAGGGYGGGSTTGGGSGSGTLLGDWTGSMTSKNAPTSSSLNNAPTVNMTFTPDQGASATGAFSMSMPQVQNASATGSYADLLPTQGQELLLLQITASTILDLGAAGQTPQLSYNLNGATLQLHGANFDANLMRPAQPSGPAPTPGPTPTPTSAPTPSPGTPDAVAALYNSWSCQDASGNIWRADLRSNFTFNIDISNPGTAASAWMTGSLRETRGQVLNTDAVLTASDSNVQSYKGMIIQAQLQDDVDLTMRRMTAQNSVAQQLNCTPQ